MCYTARSTASALLLCVLSLGAAGQGVLSSTGGRYAFGQLSEDSKLQYMLDTDTGRLWQVVNSQTHGVALDPVPYIFEVGNHWCLTPPDIEEEESAILEPMRREEQSADLLEKVIRDAIELSVDSMIEGRLRPNYTVADSLYLRAHLSDSLRFEFDMIR